jgi:hypothetical protein
MFPLSLFFLSIDRFLSLSFSLSLSLSLYSHSFFLPFSFFLLFLSILSFLLSLLSSLFVPSFCCPLCVYIALPAGGRKYPDDEGWHTVDSVRLYVGFQVGGGQAVPFNAHVGDPATLPLLLQGKHRVQRKENRL